MTPSRFVPESALRDGAVLRAIQQVLVRWSQQWLLSAAGPGSCSELPQPDAMALVGAGGSGGVLWEGPAGAVLAFLPQASITRIAGACLGRAFSTDRLNEADEQFLSDLARAAVGDFVRLLARAVTGWPELDEREGLSMVPSASRYAWFKVELGAAGGSFLLAASASVLAQIRVALVSPLAPAAALQPAISAVLDREVQIGAYAGRVRLNASELSQLKAGDVLVLEQGAGDSLVITLNDRPISGWRCDLDFPTPNAPSLKLGAPPEGVRA